MKKTLLTLAVVAITTFAANAQLKYGLLGGLDVVTINNSIDPEPEGVETENVSGFGIHLGGFGQYMITDQISVKGELQYQFRRTTDEYDANFGFGDELTTEDQTTDHFVQIPVMVQYNVTESIGIEVGPTFGFLLGSKFTSENDEGSRELTGSDATDGRNGFELGLGFGALYEFTPQLGLGARYVLALTDTIEDTEVGGATFQSRYNLIQFTLRYAIGG